jgi:hypothetical protein
LDKQEGINKSKAELAALEDQRRRDIATLDAQTRIKVNEERWKTHEGFMNDEQKSEFNAKKAIIQKSGMPYADQIAAIDALLHKTPGAAGPKGRPDLDEAEKFIENYAALDPEGRVALTVEPDGTVKAEKGGWGKGEWGPDITIERAREQIKTMHGGGAPTGDKKKDEEAGWKTTKGGKKYKLGNPNSVVR